MGSCVTYGRTSPLLRASLYLFLALIKQQSPFQQHFKVYRQKEPYKELCMFQQKTAAGKQQQSKCMQFAHVRLQLKRNILAFLRLSFLLENTDHLAIGMGIDIIQEVDRNTLMKLLSFLCKE